MTRICELCGALIPPSKRAGAKYCSKGCSGRAYQEANREAISARRRKYREANREAISAYQKAYQKEYYGANREAISAYKKACYETHREANPYWRRDSARQYKRTKLRKEQEAMK